MTQIDSSPVHVDTRTHGGAMLSSDAVDHGVKALVDHVVNASAHITDIRGPIDGVGESYDALLARATATKGRPLMFPFIGSGLGNGALVELGDGSVKWDMITGIGVHFFGHSHPTLIEANLRASLEDTTKHGNLQSNFEAFRFAEILIEQAQKHSDLKHCFLTTSGAMANESALKICYQKHYPASRVIAFKHCFMGRSVTMAQIGDSAAGRDGIPLSTQVDYMPFWNDDAVEKVGGKKNFIDHACWRLQQLIDRYPRLHACFIFEMVQGEGGFNVAPREYLLELIKICKANSIAVWDDEIQSFGRGQRMFAYEHFELGEFVDVFCVGKMTQGCAVLSTDAYNPRPGLNSGTFTGTSTDFAAGVKTLEMLRDGDYYDTVPGANDGRIAKHHAEFRRHAEALMAKHSDWFPPVPFGGPNPGGIGGMMRLTPFGGDKAKVAAACKACYEEGVLLLWCGHGPYHVRMLPPLGVFKMEDWGRVFEAIERAFARVAAKG